jgi:ankyrin repeat protein
MAIPPQHPSFPHGLIVYDNPTLAVPDFVNAHGVTPLFLACESSSTKVVVALLDAGANIDFAATPPSSSTRPSLPGLTPLMCALGKKNTGVAKLLLKRGAEGTKRTTLAADGLAAGSTALDIARTCVGGNPDSAETLEVLRKRCCSACGVTSRNLRDQHAECVGVSTEARLPQLKLQLCSGCPRHGARSARRRTG